MMACQIRQEVQLIKSFVLGNRMFNLVLQTTRAVKLNIILIPFKRFVTKVNSILTVQTVFDLTHQETK